MDTKPKSCPRRFLGIFPPRHNYEILCRTAQRDYVACNDCQDRYILTFANGFDMAPAGWEKVRHIVNWAALRAEITSDKNCCRHCPHHH